jgi:3-hydroxyisobutyrate dehydrogenase-like beta-hydroxyacid dehydrogenase
MTTTGEEGPVGVDVGAVGFIGLGQIGAPMAGRLVDWPGGLHVYDVRPEACAPVVEQGATLAASVAALGARCDVISVMVLNDEQVRSVVADLLSTARPGTIIAVHSTIRAETAEELAAEAAGREVDLLDGPVSGGFVGAHDGTLAAMVGGQRPAHERAKPVFERWASVIVHMGPAGAGTRTKLARNLLHFIAFTGVAEAQRLAEAAGLDLRKLARVVRHSDSVTGGPGAIMLRDSTAPLQPGDDWYDVLSHTRDLGEKDLTLALELAEQLGVDLPLGRQALVDFATGLGVPHGDA